MDSYDAVLLSLGLEPSTPKRGRGTKRDGTTKGPVECGTYSGYNTHIAHGEDACDPCRAAKAAYHRDYYAKNRDRIRHLRRLKTPA